MRDRDRRSPYAPPEPESSAPEPPATVAGVFAEMRARVEEAVERDRAEAARRGPMAKALYAATTLAVVAGAAIFFYGAYTFYDGPIRQTPTGYVSKHGTPYPREHYERYKLWEKAVLGAFGAVAVTGLAATIADRRRK